MKTSILLVLYSIFLFSCSNSSNKNNEGSQTFEKQERIAQCSETVLRDYIESYSDYNCHDYQRIQSVELLNYCHQVADWFVAKYPNTYCSYYNYENQNSKIVNTQDMQYLSHLIKLEVNKRVPLQETGKATPVQTKEMNPPVEELKTTPSAPTVLQEEVTEDFNPPPQHTRIGPLEEYDIDYEYEDDE